MFIQNYSQKETEKQIIRIRIKLLSSRQYEKKTKTKKALRELFSIINLLMCSTKTIGIGTILRGTLV